MVQVSFLMFMCREHCNTVDTFSSNGVSTATAHTSTRAYARPDSHAETKPFTFSGLRHPLLAVTVLHTSSAKVMNPHCWNTAEFLDHTVV